MLDVLQQPLPLHIGNLTRLGCSCSVRMHLYRVLFVDTLTFLHQVFNYLNHDEVLDCCLRSALSKTADGRRRWLGAISDPFL